MSDSDYDFLICVYCDRDLPGDATWCSLCHEYKGLMTVEAWEKYTGEKWFDPLDSLEDTEGYQMTDAEADADTFASAGWGTDEDYGFFGEDY